jgi:5-methylcytosine-specific restriction endonuclease McrA
MNLKHLTDDQLEDSLGILVRKERETLSAILHHLLEVNRRRLFSKYHCKSLHDYACKKYGYSEREAGLRITAMYLLKDVPQATRQIEEGSVSLTNLVQAQVHFRKEAKENIDRTAVEKLELITKLENCSKTEAQQVIADEAETLFRAGGVSVPLSRDENMPFRPSAQLKAKLRRLREVKTHASLEDLIEEMTDLALGAWDPLEKAKRAVARKAKKETMLGGPQQNETQTQIQKEMRTKNRVAQGLNKTQEKFSTPESKRCVEVHNGVAEKNDSRPSCGIERKSRCGQKRPRYIQMKVRHDLQLRDQAKCVNCGSRKNLEPDHVQDFARGGSNEIENLRLLCRSCNQRHAIESYGLKKMSSYLKSRAIAYH